MLRNYAIAASHWELRWGVRVFLKRTQMARQAGFLLITAAFFFLLGQFTSWEPVCKATCIGKVLSNARRMVGSSFIPWLFLHSFPLRCILVLFTELSVFHARRTGWLNLVLVWVSISVIKYHDPKQLGEERIYFSLQFYLHCTISLRKARMGIQMG